MESSLKREVAKVGWVEKRSAYLKQWRRRWLVLANSCLCTYKSENTSDVPTERIPLSSILDVSRIDADAQHPHSFRISTRTRVFTLATPVPDQAKEWVGAIEAVSQPSETYVPSNKIIEKHRQSQETVESAFSAVFATLEERENRLKSEVDGLYEGLVSKAKEEINLFQEAADRCEDLYRQFRLVYERQDLSNAGKLQLINKLSRETETFKEFDIVADSSVKTSVPEKQLVSQILRENVTVSMENPHEFQVRRTLITRALKWRYNGERIDALSFSVSKSVLLTGIGICRPCKSQGRIYLRELKIAQGNSTASPVIYTHTPGECLIYSARESVQQLSFAGSTYIRPNIIYTLVCRLEGDASYKCVECFRSIATEGDVMWTFCTTMFQLIDQSNRTDVVCGPIADFYYMLVLG